MDDDLGDKMDDEDENFKDGQELKDDGAPRANAVGYDEYLSKIGVDQAERDEEVTGSIKSFCQKRRRVVYESITNSKNPVEEEEERFSAHIEAFGHKMRAKVETVSSNVLRLILILVHPRASLARLAQAKAQPIRISSDYLSSEDPRRPTHRTCQTDPDTRNKRETRQRVPTKRDTR